MLILITPKLSKPRLVTYMVCKTSQHEVFLLALYNIKTPFNTFFLSFIEFSYLNQGDSTCGQRALYPLGMTGIPIFNVNNNCATGSTALFMASQFISGGIVDCVLALGFEKMQKGSLAAKVHYLKQLLYRTNLRKILEISLSVQGYFNFTHSMMIEQIH